MMNFEKTFAVLDVIFDSCTEFWLGEGKDDYASHKLALMDIEGIVTNPLSPLGDTLNPDAKAEFIKGKMEWLA